MSKVMNYVTKEGLEKMKAELELLESIERPKITQQIAEARDKGDLSDKRSKKMSKCSMISSAVVERAPR